MKLRYRISWLSKFLVRRKIVVAICILFAAIPALRMVSGVNLAAPVVRFFLGLAPSTIPTMKDASLPRLQLVDRVRCAIGDKSLQLPVYELQLTANDFRKLAVRPGQISNYALTGVTVRYRSADRRTDRVESARIRRRGIYQARKEEQFAFKILFRDPPISGFKQAHLIPISAAGKDTFWWPIHMWLANKLGLIVPENRIVRVKVNGKYWGPYWEFEHWGRNTFENYGITDAVLYGENDDHDQNVEGYLWKNTDFWKKYDTGTGIDSNPADFRYLADFLEFVNTADDETFRRHIFDYIDLKNVVNWIVHMSLLDSFHQNDSYNSRLLYNKVTGKFELIPWDAFSFQRRLGISVKGLRTRHVLIVRLFSNVRFQKAFSKRLYEVSTEIVGDRALPVAKLYLNDAVRCAFVESRYALRLTQEDLFKTGRLKQLFWANALNEKVGEMRNFLAGNAAAHKKLMAEAVLFAARETTSTKLQIKTTSGTSFRRLAKLGYSAQPATVINSVTLPLNTTKFDGRKFDVELKLEPRPLPPTYWLPFHPAGKLPPTQSVRRTITVRNGLMAMENLDFTLLPSFPKFRSVRGGDIDGALRTIEAQDYDLLVRISGRLPVDYEKVELAATNAATGRPVEIIYKNLGGRVRDFRLAARTPPEKLARRYNWLAFDDAAGTLKIAAGTITLRETVVIPKGTRLEIAAGTHIKMAPGVSLISYSPIEARGTRKRPIVFSGGRDGRKWGVIAVLNSSLPSTLSNLKIRDAGTAKFLGLHFQGAVNFHLSPVQISGITCKKIPAKCVSIIGRKGGRYVSENADR